MLTVHLGVITDKDDSFNKKGCQFEYDFPNPHNKVFLEKTLKAMVLICQLFLKHKKIFLNSKHETYEGILFLHFNEPKLFY